ncbi:MAG TPA: hypothetical protein PKI52_17710 [Aggregatilineales bacterium]|jgi:hypothetical protein|nr:hypothetical protein [Aggregatilineales bacterium]
MRKIPSAAIVLLGIVFFAAGVLTLVAGVVNMLSTAGNIAVDPRLFVVLPLSDICSGLAFLAVPVTLYFLLPPGDERD